MKNQQLQIKAGIDTKEKLIREYTDKAFVLDQRISQLRHELKTNRILEAGLEEPINSIQARIFGGFCTVNRLDENNELLPDLHLLPDDVSKWPAMLESSFVREPAKWVPDKEFSPQVRIRLDTLKSRVMKAVTLEKDSQESRSDKSEQHNGEPDILNVGSATMWNDMLEVSAEPPRRNNEHPDPPEHFDNTPKLETLRDTPFSVEDTAEGEKTDGSTPTQEKQWQPWQTYCLIIGAFFGFGWRPPFRFGNSTICIGILGSGRLWDCWPLEFTY